MLLKSWNFRQMDAHLGLQLLSPSNPDPRVRLFGVRLLQAKLNPVDLQYYLLQVSYLCFVLLLNPTMCDKIVL